MHDILYWFDSKQVVELMYPSMFYGYFPTTYLDHIYAQAKPHKDHFALMLDSIKLCHIKDEDLCFLKPFVM